MKVVASRGGRKPPKGLLELALLTATVQALGGPYDYNLKHYSPREEHWVKSGGTFVHEHTKGKRKLSKKKRKSNKF